MNWNDIINTKRVEQSYHNGHIDVSFKICKHINQQHRGRCFYPCI